MDTHKIKQAYRLNQWTEIIRQCRSSGQTVAAFCKEQNLKPQSYYYWLKLVREAACKALPVINNDTNMIVPLTFGEPPTCSSKSVVTSKITLHYGDFSLELEENTSPLFIENIIRTLMNLQKNESC